MSRRFLVDIQTDIDAKLADNITKDILPVNMRDILGDMNDSLKQDEAALTSSSATNGLATAVSFEVLDTVYDAQQGGDGDFLNTVFGVGTITGTSTPGFTYAIVGTISVSGTNNVAIQIGVGVDGVQTGFITRHEASGITEFYTMSVRLLVNAAIADSVFTMMIATPDGISSVDIADATLGVIIHPTNDP